MEGDNGTRASCWGGGGRMSMTEGRSSKMGAARGQIGV